jgi:hypothetical protein
MPVVFRHEGHRFFIFSNEGNPREPMHIHVTQGGRNAQFWVWPFVRIAENDGFDPQELRNLAKIIEFRRGQIVRSWNEFFT